MTRARLRRLAFALRRLTRRRPPRAPRRPQDDLWAACDQRTAATERDTPWW